MEIVPKKEKEKEKKKKTKTKQKRKKTKPKSGSTFQTNTAKPPRNTTTKFSSGIDRIDLAMRRAHKGRSWHFCGQKLQLQKEKPQA